MSHAANTAMRAGAGRLRLVIAPGLLVALAACSGAAGLLLFGLRVRLGDGMPTSALDFLAAGVLVLTAMLVHELAHAAAAAATGRRVERVVLGKMIGVYTSGGTTPLRRALAIAAGPLTEIAVGAAYWQLAGGGAEGALTPLGVAGVVALINGTSNMLPFHPAGDGWKLARFLLLARRTGNAALPCTPEDCPACTGRLH